MEYAYEMSDIYVSAFLVHKGLLAHLKVLPSGKVIFVFPPSDKIKQFLNEFNNDGDVPVDSYVRCLRSLRGRMISLKNMGTNRGQR